MWNQVDLSGESAKCVNRNKKNPIGRWILEWAGPCMDTLRFSCWDSGGKRTKCEFGFYGSGQEPEGLYPRLSWWGLKASG